MPQIKEPKNCSGTADRTASHLAWRQAFGRPPPKRLSTRFVQKALAWQAQAKTTGGLSSASRRALRSIAKGAAIKAAVSVRVPAGTRLVREWNGRTWQVEVVEGGFVMDGRPYASLSAIARRITGAHWSGPRFFGISKATGCTR